MEYSSDMERLLLVFGLALVGVAPFLGFALYAVFNGDKVFSVPEKSSN